MVLQFLACNVRALHLLMHGHSRLVQTLAPHLLNCGAVAGRRWVSNLSRFLQHLVGQLGRRLTLENSPKDIDDGFDSESDDGSEAPQSGPGDDEQVLLT